MIKEYTTKNIKQEDLEEVLQNVINYYKMYDMNICKVKTISKEKTLNIFAFDNVKRIAFSSNYDTCLVYYDTNDCICINLKTLNVISFEIYDINEFEKYADSDFQAYFQLILDLNK